MSLVRNTLHGDFVGWALGVETILNCGEMEGELRERIFGLPNSLKRSLPFGS